MSGIRMVPLVTVTSGFQARVIAARLGADGILIQVRGGVDGPYPIGAVDVLVAEDELDLARRLLSAAPDAEADADAPDGGGDPRAAVLHGPSIALVAALALVAVTAVSLFSRLL